MNKGVRLAIAAAVGASALCLVIAARLVDREPTYNGLTIREWFDGSDDAQRGEALLILGTNNLDLFVKRLRYDPHKDWLARRINKLPGKWQNALRLDRIVMRRADRSYEAFQVLGALGSNAAPAIPKLEALTEHGGPPSVHALGLLSRMGPDGLAIVASKVTHTNLSVRLLAVGMLEGRRDSAVARTALTNALADPDDRVRQSAWFALRPRE